MLPERWEVQVDVYNGTTGRQRGRRLRQPIAGLAYHMGDVDDAKKKNYDKTLVYYPPGRRGHRASASPASSDVGTAALPGGDNPLRLVVIVGKRTS